MADLREGQHSSFLPARLDFRRAPDVREPLCRMGYRELSIFERRRLQTRPCRMCVLSSVSAVHSMGFVRHRRSRCLGRNDPGEFVFVGCLGAFFQDGGPSLWRTGGRVGAVAVADVSGFALFPIHLHGVTVLSLVDAFLPRLGTRADGAGAHNGILAAVDPGGGHFLRVSAPVAFVFQITAILVDKHGQSAGMGWKDRARLRTSQRRIAGTEFLGLGRDERGLFGSGAIFGMGHLLSAHGEMDRQRYRGV